MLRRELRANIEDRSKLSHLHTVVTEKINESYGEEKEMLIKFRQEIKDALNCKVLGVW